jgi:hypothetical protein
MTTDDQEKLSPPSSQVANTTDHPEKLSPPPPPVAKATDDLRDTPAPQACPLPSRMPDAWVQQLAETKRMDWPTILGSAVLAALIGWASSYFTAKMTIEANVQLEQSKINLQLAQEHARALSAAYTSLAGTLTDLHTAFASYLVFAQAASSHGLSKEDRNALSSQGNEVGKAEAKVVRATSNPILASSPLLTDVDSCLADLVPLLDKAGSAPTSVPAHKSIETKLADLASRAQQEASKQVVGAESSPQ